MADMEARDGDGFVASRQEEVLALLKEIRELLGPGVLTRAIYTKKEASHLLSCSVSKLNAQIRAGRLFPVPWGGQWMITRSEIERISNAAPQEPKKRRPALSLVKKAPQEEAARARAALKSRRKSSY